MTALLAFLLVALASFVGSLQPGPVNVAVFHATLRQGRRSAIWVSIGGSLPELLFCGIAAFGLTMVHIPAWAEPWLRLLPGLLLLVLGYVLLRQAPAAHIPPVEPAKGGWLRSLWWGLVLGGSNPQLVAYWVLVLTYVKAIVPVDDTTAWAVALGAGVGAFLLHLVVMAGAHRLQQRQDLPRWMRRVAWAVLGLGGLQLAWALVLLARS